MELRIKNTIDSEEWNKNIEILGGSIFHSAEWAEFKIYNSKNIIPIFFSLISEDGKIIGAALGFKISKSIISSYFTKKMVFDAAPLVLKCEKILLNEFTMKLIDYAYANGYVEMAIGSFASPEKSDIFRNLDLNKLGRFEFELSLKNKEDDIWKALTSKRRNHIRKAINNGVKIEILENMKGIKELKRLQDETRIRIKKRGGPEIIQNDNSEDDKLYKFLSSGCGLIIGAIFSGEIVSAGLFSYFNKQIYFMRSGHNQKGLKLQAPSLLLWESIKIFKKKGAEKFNFGGCKEDAIDKNSSENGVYNFKMSYNPVLLKCTTGWKILNKNKYKIIKIIRQLFR